MKKIDWSYVFYENSFNFMAIVFIFFMTPLCLSIEEYLMQLSISIVLASAQLYFSSRVLEGN